MMDGVDVQWTASTLGHFIGLLVDGQDPAVLFRITQDTDPDDEGWFIRRLQVIQVPDGYVRQVIDEYGCERVHKGLAALMEAGVLK